MSATAQTANIHASSAMSTDVPDDILVADAVGGDSWSFEVLIRRHQRRILAVSCRMTGSFADAEDIAQQTFMKAFLGIRRFQSRSSFSTWLTTIALNEARMWKRKKSRAREVSGPGYGSEDCTAQPVEMADSRPDPEATYSEKERRIVLFSGIAGLNPSVRSALEACDLQGESTKATALTLGITVPAVKSRRSRGRAALRRALAHAVPELHGGDKH
jgi:RNA polymerase sigma-70 factor, ECF subfamily